MKRLFNLKNLFVSFLVFGFLVFGFNFVFADDSCSCVYVAASGSSGPRANPTCSSSGMILVKNQCGTATGDSQYATGSCVCEFRGTGGLVPCVNDCTTEDLFGSSTVDKPPIWTSLIRTAMGISGIIILCIFVYGGVRIIVSRGDKAKIKAAQDIMKNSIYGLLIVVFAYTFVKFLITILTGSNWRLFFGG